MVILFFSLVSGLPITLLVPECGIVPSPFVCIVTCFHMYLVLQIREVISYYHYLPNG